MKQTLRVLALLLACFFLFTAASCGAGNEEGRETKDGTESVEHSGSEGKMPPEEEAGTDASVFRFGMAPFSQGEKWGFINKMGEWVI